MKYAILLCLFFCQATALKAQKDSINLYNSSGEKNGLWIEYLDSNLFDAKDTNTAAFYRYTWYENGFNLISMGAIGSKSNPVIFKDAAHDPSKKCKALNGRYYSCYKNGQVHFDLTAKDGYFISYKEYFEDGVLNKEFDYTHNCGSKPHSYCIKMYSKKGELIYEGYGLRKSDMEDQKALKKKSKISPITK